jgi:hypothetical protein
MTMCFHCRLAGIALILGGLIASISHLFPIEPTSDPALLEQYAHLSEPLHLMLFAGGILVLLGWFGQYAVQSAASGVTGLITFLSIFLGILFGDLLHCILEFSIFPVLSSSVPYALPALAESCYRITPFALMLRSGHFLIIAGVAAAIFSLLRDRILPVWTVVPFAITAVLLCVALLPRFSALVGPLSLAALYVSMAVLGVAIVKLARPKIRNAS